MASSIQIGRNALILLLIPMEPTKVLAPYDIFLTNETFVHIDS